MANQSYEAWLELLQQAYNAAQPHCPEFRADQQNVPWGTDWKPFYDEGLTPADALQKAIAGYRQRVEASQKARKRFGI